MIVHFRLDSIEDYRRFLAIKQLPKYKIRGRTAEFPDEYAERLGLKTTVETPIEYKPHPAMFDYQKDITRLALTKKRFAFFWDCGLGKTLAFLDWARHVCVAIGSRRKVLIVSPLMVVGQTVAEWLRFWPDENPPEILRASNLREWLLHPKEDSRQIGITNWEALRDDVESGCLGALILDESSMLKSHYGKHGRKAIELGKGLDWKLACTGTPAPNDRIEYANHAVFLDQFPTINAFLARYFVNRGQTDNRWELKPHALYPFYRSLSHWCVFLTNPATYGWKDNTSNIPPIHVHIHDVAMTAEQESLTMDMTQSLFAHRIGGITNRATLASIGKGFHKGRRVASDKPQFIRDLVDSWPDESTIIWCLYNKEQDLIEEQFPEAASIRGETSHEKRMELIGEFKSGHRKVLISKPKILGFGLNLQIATRQVFSGLQDSYESFYQAVKRSNRYGSTRPLNVHIPVTDIELPMVETVLRKSKMIQKDTETQEEIFRDSTIG